MRIRGIICTMVAAVIFGVTPILARITYDGGSNGISMSFFRGALALPVLFALLRLQHIDLRVERRLLLRLMATGGLGTAATIVLLYWSYHYIGVGMATTLHFIYPVFVMAGCVLWFRERINAYKLASLVIACAGVLLFFGKDSSFSAVGLALALASGVTYAFYMIAVDQWRLTDLHYFKLSFYLCVMTALSAGAFGLATGTLTFALTPQAWGGTLAVALLTSVGALALVQVGIKHIGASAAAILSTLEPITSVVLGALVLRESLSAAKIAGCVCILAGVVLITVAEVRGTAE